MADPLLTSLCSICHTTKPQYKCPRCSIRTCSLACIRKHKAWSECSGVRDPTVYKPRKELRTPAGIDHDYNFLHKLETTMQRTEKDLVEERALIRPEEMRKVPLTIRETKWKVGRDGRKRRVVITRELKEPTGQRQLERLLTNRLWKLGVKVLFAPQGMERQKENTTSFNRRSGCVNWQVEWLRLEDDGQKVVRTLGKTMDDVPLFTAYHLALEGQNKAPPPKDQQAAKASRAGRSFTQVPSTSIWNTASALYQEPWTGRWVSAQGVEKSGAWPSDTDRERQKAFDYFLANPRQKSDEPKALRKLEVGDCLREILRNGAVLEFPTIYVLQKGKALPSGYVIQNQSVSEAPQSSKRKSGQAKNGPKSKRQKKSSSDIEEGEAESGDEGMMDNIGDGSAAAGLEVGDIVAEESFGEEEDDDEEDDDSPTSSSGSDTSDEDSD